MRCVARLLVPLLVMLNISPWAVAADNAPLSDTRIVHQPLATTASGVALPVSATVEDSAGVEVVRVYFKSTVGTIYYYTPLTRTTGTTYSGVIPAAAADAGQIEYLILVKNKKNVVFKSRQYQTAVSEKPGKPEARQGTIKVYSESPYASKHIIGFADGYDFQVADPSEKYGVVAGLYNPETVSWIATDAVAGGTESEPEKTSWSPYLIGGAAVAGIAVVAVALGGGGGGGGDSEPPAEEPPTEEPTVPPPVQAPDASGTWKLTSYQYTPACTSGVGSSQTVTCTAANTFGSVTPASLNVAVPDTATPGSCIGGTTAGLAEVFTGECDAEAACSKFSPSNLTSKTCGTDSITIVRDGGAHIQTWQKQ